MSAAAKKPWYTGLVKSKKQKLFERIAEQISEGEDWRDYDLELEDNPDIVNMQGPNGKTLVILAAESEYPDAMANLIENHNADVTLRDKAGKTPADYFNARIDADVKNINDRLARGEYSPKEADNEKKELESTRKYFMDMINRAKTVKTAQLAEPLTRVSKEFGELRGDKKMDALALASQFVVGEKGVPKTVVAEARKTLGRGRKTRKNKKTRKGKSRRV